MKGPRPGEFGDPGPELPEVGEYEEYIYSSQKLSINTFFLVPRHLQSSELWGYLQSNRQV